MSMPASTSIIPQGVGAPPPPGLDPKRGKLMCIKVRMLDDTVGVFHLGHKALGQALFDEVCRHLNLLECDYFGLEFLDCYGNHCWLDKEKPILRQITSTQSDARFYFVVKFYTPNPADLEEEYTRYLFALQVKRDLATGQFVCNENTGALMVSYVVQSECGDFSPEDYPDHTYLSTVRFVPNQTPEFEKKIMENHRKLVGLSPAESDLALLETARRCDFYGVKFHPARDIEGTAVNLSILHLGIRVYHQLACASTFSWAKIRKLSFKRKKFLIKLHPEAYVSYQYYKDTIEFVFEVRNEAKAFWKKAVEHHTFFRCNESVRVINKQPGLFTSGSSFRYFGRTQKQLIDYVREHHKRREPFTRPIHSSFARSGRALHPADRSSSGERNLPTPLIPDPRVSGRGQNGNLVSERTHTRMGPLHKGSPPDYLERDYGQQASTPDNQSNNRRSASSMGSKGATTISFHVPTTMSSGGLSSYGLDGSVLTSSPDHPFLDSDHCSPPYAHSHTSPTHTSGNLNGGRANHNNRHSVPRSTHQAHKDPRAVHVHHEVREGELQHSSRNTTITNSTGALTLRQHDDGASALHLSRSLVPAEVKNGTFKAHEGEHHYGSHPHAGSVHHPLHHHYHAPNAGYLSADNDDNISEDSYHLSDAEPVSRSPPTTSSRKSPTNAQVHQVPLSIAASGGQLEKPKKSVEFRDSPAPNAAPPGDPSVSVPTSSSAVTTASQSKQYRVNISNRDQGEDEVSSMYSKVRQPKETPPEEIYAEYGRYAEVQPVSSPLVLSKVEVPSVLTVQSKPVTTSKQHKGLPQSSSVDVLASSPSSESNEKAVPKTYGAVGPLRGKVLTRQGPIVIAPEGPPAVAQKPKSQPELIPTHANTPKGQKPVPPPKPKNVSLRSPDVIPPQPTHPAPPKPDLQDLQMYSENPKQTYPPAPPAPAIEVQNVDNPQVQHRFLLNGGVPYVLHMRHVPKTPEGAPPPIIEPPTPPPPLPSPMAEGGRVPFSTFKDPQGTRTIPNDVNADSTPLTLNPTPRDRGRTLEKTEVSEGVTHRPRKKSLELVQRKRLPSPATFSSQDHSVSPTTPESGNVLDYLLRRRSASQEAKKLSRKAKKRTDNRRQTQPVRFSTPDETKKRMSSFGQPGTSTSQPTLSTDGKNVEADYDSDDFSMESRSLHEDMDALEAFETVNADRLSASSVESPCGSIPPPPPPLASEQLGPPPPPPAVPGPTTSTTDISGFGSGPDSKSDRKTYQGLLESSDPPFIDDTSIGSNGNASYGSLVRNSIEYLRRNGAELPKDASSNLSSVPKNAEKPP